jgi:inosose dehydratase
MERSKMMDEPVMTAFDARIGAGPISWGVCEVPGWGAMLPAERVLAEMAALDITATELGAPGFLPRRPDELRSVLDRHGIRLIGGFVPLVLHNREHRAATLADARSNAELLAAAGASVLVSAAVVDLSWSRRLALSLTQWDHLLGMLDELTELCADHGLLHALHPHVGTLIETGGDVRTVLDRSSVEWCLDTGHLLIGGYDPATFAADAAGRVVHTHLKDVRLDLAEQVGRGDVALIDAVRRGLFCPLGRGDAPVAATVEQLERDQYRGWYVLEQDIDLGGDVPPQGEGPILDARQSVTFLRKVLAGQRAD